MNKDLCFGYSLKNVHQLSLHSLLHNILTAFVFIDILEDLVCADVTQGTECLGTSPNLFRALALDIVHTHTHKRK